MMNQLKSSNPTCQLENDGAVMHDSCKEVKETLLNESAPNKKSIYKRGSSVLFAILLSSGLCTILLFATGCMNPPDPVVPYERFRPAMKEELRDHLTELEPLPVYEIDVTLDSTGLMTGFAKIVVPNNSTDIWDHLVFRLYPMMQQYGGYMALQSAAVDNEPTSFVYQPRTDKSAVRVILPTVLRPSESTEVQLSWTLQVPTWESYSDAYHLFGTTQEMTSLPLFYPSLSIYDPDDNAGLGGWWLEMGTVRGDAAHNQAALFDVTATLPSDQVPVASGTLITSTLVMSNTMAQHTWVTGPSREFLIHTSALFSAASADAAGTRVTSYWLPGDEASGRAALQYGVASLRIFNEKFGPYPFKEMRIAPAPLSFRGMEYPQVNLIGVETYNRFTNSLETLVAHEVAHQWWYQVVHNDPVKMPWLDESIAEYSIKLYMESIYGEERAQALKAERWQRRVNTLADPTIALDQAVMAYTTAGVYEAVIYSKGALFYDMLRSELGPLQFESFLKQYYERYRYKIVDTEDWRNELSTLENPRLMELYEEWVK